MLTKSSPPKNPKLFLYLLAFSFIAAISYLGYKKYQLTKIITTHQPSIQGWQVFTNKKFGYRIEHPEGITFEDQLAKGSSPGKEEKSKLWYVSKDIHSAFSDNYGIAIRTWSNPYNLSLLEWLNKNTIENKIDLWSGYYGEPELNTTIAGVDAFAFWNDSASNGMKPGECGQSCPVYMAYFTNEDMIYSITLGLFSEYNPEIFDLFNQILSTFEFIPK